MNLELPEATAEFAIVVRRALAEATADDVFAVLDGLGVLDVAGVHSADPDNAQLNVVTLLEEVARGGHRQPVAETIWARAAGLGSGSGFVAAVCAVEAPGGERIVPGGAMASWLLVGPRSAPTVVAMPGEATAAHVEIDPGHLWLPAGTAAPSLDELDQPYAWRAAAAHTAGAMTRATEMAVLHARQRVQFGKRLAGFQALQFRLTECQWRLLGLRLLVREAGWRVDRGDPLATPVSALAWLYAREVGRIVTKHAHQVHGAIGFTRELGLTTLTGSAATLRAFHPAAPAVAAVRAARGWDGTVPPSTILGGFRRSGLLT